jgi:hypothetical protein
METWLVLEYANRGSLQVRHRTPFLIQAKSIVSSYTGVSNTGILQTCQCASCSLVRQSHLTLVVAAQGQSCLTTRRADGGLLHVQSGIDRGCFQAEKASHGRGRPSLPALLHTARTIAAAMAYLHSRDIIHGDLCGGNVLLTSTDALPHRFTAKVRSRRCRTRPPFDEGAAGRLHQRSSRAEMPGSGGM